MSTTNNLTDWLKIPEFSAAYQGPRPVEASKAKPKRTVVPRLKPPERAGDVELIERTETRLRFVIHGVPMGAPRMTRRDKWAGRACVERYMSWRNNLEEIRKLLPSALHVQSLSWVAYFDPPASMNKTKLSKDQQAALIGQRHCAKPDRDNIDKALLDGLFPAEDKAIAAGGLCKVWGSPARTEVEIVFE